MGLEQAKLLCLVSALFIDFETLPKFQFAWCCGDVDLDRVSLWTTIWTMLNLSL